MLKQYDCGNYESIRLVNLALEPGKEEHDRDFVLFTKNALDLIKHVDPRRYRRIVREVRYIANSYIMTGGYYLRDLRRISVNFPLYKMDKSDPRYDLHLAIYACMLIHEATHGDLLSRGIPYNDKTWERCERLCFQEEKRFMSQIKFENYDTATLIDDINIESYKSMRNMTFATKRGFVLDLISKLFFKNHV